MGKPKQIDGNQIFMCNREAYVLRYACKMSRVSIMYSADFNDRIVVECDYMETRLDGDREVEVTQYDRIRPCPMGSHATCYAIQKLEDYYKQKEAEKQMEMSGIKDARRMPNGVMVAQDDIVCVALGYVDNGLFERIGRKKTVIGRVKSFSTNHITLDMSERFESNVIEVHYGAINDIQLSTKEDQDHARGN